MRPAGCREQICMKPFFSKRWRRKERGLADLGKRAAETVTLGNRALRTVTSWNAYPYLLTLLFKEKKKWDSANAEEKIRALNTYIIKGKAKNQWLNICHKSWQRSSKLNPKKVRRKEIIKIRGKINEIEKTYSKENNPQNQNLFSWKN